MRLPHSEVRSVGLDFIEFLHETQRFSVTQRDELQRIYNTEFRNRWDLALSPSRDEDISVGEVCVKTRDTKAKQASIRHTFTNLKGKKSAPQRKCKDKVHWRLNCGESQEPEHWQGFSKSSLRKYVSFHISYSFRINCVSWSLYSDLRQVSFVVCFCLYLALCLFCFVFLNTQLISFLY